MNDFALNFGYICMFVIGFAGITLSIVWIWHMIGRLRNFRDAKEAIADVEAQALVIEDLRRKIAELETRLGYR